MKKIKFVVLIFLAPIVIVSCEEDGVTLPEEEFFVAFETEKATIEKSSDSPLEIPVYVAAERGGEVSVEVGVQNSPDLLDDESYAGYSFAKENLDYEIPGGLTLNYPKGTGYDTLRLHSIEGGTPGDLILELVIEENSAGYRMGLPTGESGDGSKYDRFVVEFQ